MTAVDKPKVDNSTLTPNASRQLFQSPRVKLYLVLSTVFLLFIAGIYFFSLVIRKEQAAQTLDLTQQVNQLNQVQQQLNHKYQLVDELLNNIKQQSQTLQQAVEQLKLKSQSAQPKPLWTLLKARYYLELAQINIHWSDSNQVSIQLLQAADDQLIHLTNQALFPIRQAIAQEIAGLKALPSVDKAGLLSKLDAAQQLIESIPLKANNSALQVTSKTEHSWENRWHESLNVLAKLIIIRHHNDQQYLTAEQRLYAKEVLHLHLLAAGHAVLEKNQPLFDQSIQQSIELINQHFSTQSTLATSLLKLLNNLKNQSLAIKKPRLNKSLKLLNRYLEENQEPSVANSAVKESR